MLKKLHHFLTIDSLESGCGKEETVQTSETTGYKRGVSERLSLSEVKMGRGLPVSKNSVRFEESGEISAEKNKPESPHRWL